ncbi:Reductases with broad range of substrate specificities [Ceraceosorus bombacis]|uniref:Reductases with broad range of substrate specificities n=1 Tax=Ceraceosorus bombacis TaxID=401625 RepID=A0A0N7L902_9BASI|nr:Reductases with broad range of substrate specificities [Ceraceosorus bombacis]
MTSSRFQPAQLYDLSDRVALVTGGATGIGLAQAQGLAGAGARVYIASRRNQVVENAVKQYGFAGGFEVDVTSKESIQKLADDLKAKEGRADIVIANAGGAGPTHFGADTSFPDGSMDPAKKLEKVSAEEYSKRILQANSFENWNDLFSLNSHSILFTAITLLPLLAAASEKAKQEGKNHTSVFMSTGSISGVVKQSQMHYAYNAAKASANHLTETLAYEFTTATTARVRVNGILPGVFPSQMTADSKDEKTNKSDLSDKLPTMNVPVGRPGTEEEMASAVIFLASNEYMSGSLLTVDGGFTAYAP